MNLYDKLLDALDFINQDVIQCIEEDKLMTNISKKMFYHTHLQAFRLLPRVLQIVGAGYTLAKEEEKEKQVDENEEGSELVKKATHLIDRISNLNVDEKSPQVIRDSFLKKTYILFKTIGLLVAQKNTMACYILQGFYMKNAPELFDFVATYLRNEQLIRKFLSPLWD